MVLVTLAVPPQLPGLPDVTEIVTFWDAGGVSHPAVGNSVTVYCTPGSRPGMLTEPSLPDEIVMLGITMLPLPSGTRMSFPSGSCTSKVKVCGWSDEPKAPIEKLPMALVIVSVTFSPEVIGIVLVAEMVDPAVPFVYGVKDV